VPNHDEISNYVAELHPEDGVAPPRRTGGSRRSSEQSLQLLGGEPARLCREGEGASKRPPEHKLRALCSQVRRTLELVLPADLELEVRDVIPDADPARLIVLLQAPGGPGQLAGLHARVEGLAPALRREVARAITRKRCPDLSYRIAPAPRR